MRAAIEYEGVVFQSVEFEFIRDLHPQFVPMGMERPGILPGDEGNARIIVSLHCPEHDGIESLEDPLAPEVPVDADGAVNEGP